MNEEMKKELNDWRESFKAIEKNPAMEIKDIRFEDETSDHDMMSPLVFGAIMRFMYKTFVSSVFNGTPQEKNHQKLMEAAYEDGGFLAGYYEYFKTKIVIFSLPVDSKDDPRTLMVQIL